MLYNIVLFLQTQSDPMTGVHIRGGAAKLSIGGCSIELDGTKLKSSCQIEQPALPTTTLGPDSSGNPGIGHFDGHLLVGPAYTSADDTYGLSQGTFEAKAQYEVEWEIKWEDQTPPVNHGSYKNFVHFGAEEGDRAPALWLHDQNSKALHYSWDAQNGGYETFDYDPSVSFEANGEYKFSMTMMNDAGTGNSGCTAQLKITPQSTGIEHVLLSRDSPDCNKETGTQNIWVNDGWYEKAIWSTRNLRYRYWE
jgi:hypothetical protein